MLHSHNEQPVLGIGGFVNCFARLRVSDNLKLCECVCMAAGQGPATEAE